MRLFLLTTAMLLVSAGSNGKVCSAAEAQSDVPTITIDQLMRISSHEELLKLEVDRVKAFSWLLEQVKDEQSAQMLARSLERRYLERILIDMRRRLLPESDGATEQRLGSLYDALSDAGRDMRRECRRIEQLPAAAAQIEAVLDQGCPTPREAATVSMLQTLRSQIELYKLQHGERQPDFRKQGWAQLIKKTNEAGETGASDFGPYMQAAPVNPMNRCAKILVVRGSPKADFKYAGGDCGFVIDEISGHIWALDEEGRIFREGTELKRTAGEE